MSKKILYIVIALIIILALAGAGYYFFLSPQAQNGTAPGSIIKGFNPFNREPIMTNNPVSTSTNNKPVNTELPTITKIPTLRLLSSTPVGGYGASTTASTTAVRWVDRGRGDILEAHENTLEVATLSNTLLPKTYDSVWDKNLNNFVGSILDKGDSPITTIYASLITHKSATTTKASSTTPFLNSMTNTTPYELRGKNLPSNIVSYVASPKKDRLFLFAVQNGQGIGYVAPFNGGTATQIFITPITQVNIDWPEENTIVITTSGSATQPGYLYFVNPKTGDWKSMLGPINGLSAKVSHDAKYIIASAPGADGSLLTSIYTVSNLNAIDAVIRTLADKCTWGNFYKTLVYCGVPFERVTGVYPDDWYKGTLSTVDKIWQVNAVTGEVHLVGSLSDQSDRPINTFNLGLDDKDNFLFFMNKNDLSLWSLDLVSGNQ